MVTSRRPPPAAAGLSEPPQPTVPPPGPSPSRAPSAADAPAPPSPWRRLAGPLALAALMFAFFLGLDMMGLAFKLFGKGFAEMLIERTANPFVGLLVGILATTLVQSSSTTTSMTVGLVAAGALTIDGAIPIIMGSNIGTSVTNTLVSLAHVSRREEFRRAFAGATLHDFFNLMTVIVLFPLELRFHILRRSASWLEQILEGSGGIQLFDPLKAVVRPVAQWLSGTLLGSSGGLTLAAGVLLLFFALKLLVDLLKSLAASRAERILDRTLFRSALSAVGAGVVITVMVQSSSITTSVMVPLVGAGVVTLERLFPFTIGANLGTTVTALLASLATGDPAAVSVALAHLVFNVLGTLIIYPVPLLRAIPLALARALGALGSRNRPAAVAYVLSVFYGLPILLLFLSGAFRGDGDEAPPPPAPPPVEAPAPPHSETGAREEPASGAALTSSMAQSEFEVHHV
ncbi:MAG TPA: Na/Pi symporter [Thermoanaerobaculia bacterium]|nr:Na/Pi symporter [Thermoanaerobaculia bacterium]